MKVEDTSRIVIKIGSSLLFDEETNKLNFDWLVSLAEDVKYLRNLNKDVVIVSSGAIALGAKTEKMLNGHRGGNQPVQSSKNNKVEITSQNHGFVVRKNNLPKNIEITYSSLFDGVIEGIKVKNKPILSVQYHPEASPGPQDTFNFFDSFHSSVNGKEN